MSQKDPEANFLNSLFIGLNGVGIRYAVMRNYLPLPYSAGGSDLDLMVSAEDGARTRPLIYRKVLIKEGCNGSIVATKNVEKLENALSY
jgi:hypothetical protein